jgi:hypothetical protein
MNVFEVELSDGRILDIEANDEASAQRAAEQWLRSQQPSASPDKPIGAGTAAIRGGASGLLDTALGIPDFLIKQAVSTVFPPERDQLLNMQLAPRAVQGMLSEDRILPIRGENLIPGMDEAREQHPGVTGLAEALGPGVALMMGRAPLVRSEIPALRATEQTGLATRNFMEQLTANPGLARAVSDTLNRPSMQTLARGAGRAVETSLEGAAISILQGGDPVETAAYAAGGQAIGSVALHGVKGMFSGGVIRAGGKMAITAAGLTALLQVGKEAIPGGRDRILESIESSFAKIMYGVAIGGLAGLAGAGRVSGKNMPVLMDGITSIPRGAALSVLSDFLDEKDRGINTTERALTHLTVNPEKFNKTQLTRIEKALEEGNLGATLAQMLETDPRFAKVMDTDPGAFKEPEFLTRGQRKQLDKARLK